MGRKWVTADENDRLNDETLQAMAEDIVDPGTALGAAVALVAVGGGEVIVPTASTEVKGIVELADDSQTVAGIADNVAVTPAGLATALSGLGGGIDVTIAPTPPSNGFWIEGTTTTVTATAPTFTDLSGTASDSYTIPAVANIVYRVGGIVTAAGTYPGSGTVLVEAEAAAGYSLTGTTAWSYTFSTSTDPTPVTPNAPTFNDTADTYTIPTTTGVDYQISGSTVAAGTYSVGNVATTVTVNAVAQSGYTLTGTTSWMGTYTVTSGDPLALDTFTAADSTALPGRTTDASGATSQFTWVNANASTATIVTNQANVASGVATLDIGIDTYKLTITSVQSASATKVVLRWVDLDNYVYLEHRAASGKWGIISRAGGVNTLVFDSGVTPAAGQVLEVTADGTGYALEINGTPSGSGSDSYLATNTKVGFRGGGSTAKWDNLIIETL